ncbi:MAG: GNAT family N-acetyltransferase [Flammeovirgaceae bacterium]|nr:GNAT family N-acetyltransferase [Flammeovirgaceae bacterium]
MNIFNTKRLRIQPFEITELALIHQLFTHPFIRKYLWDDVIISREKCLEILSENKSLFDEKKFGLWKITEKNHNRVVGFVGLWYFFDESQPQLLYGLLPEFTGIGYALEASKVIVDYALNTLCFSHLDAACDKPNRPSQKVVIALGMKLIKKEEKEGKSTVFYRTKK